MENETETTLTMLSGAQSAAAEVSNEAVSLAGRWAVAVPVDR